MKNILITLLITLSPIFMKAQSPVPEIDSLYWEMDALAMRAIVEENVLISVYLMEQYYWAEFQYSQWLQGDFIVNGVDTTYVPAPINFHVYMAWKKEKLITAKK